MTFSRLRGTGVIEVVYPPRMTTLWVHAEAPGHRIILGMPPCPLERNNKTPFPPTSYGTLALRFVGAQQATLLTGRHLDAEGVAALADIGDLIAQAHGDRRENGDVAWFRRLMMSIMPLIAAYARVPQGPEMAVLLQQFRLNGGPSLQVFPATAPSGEYLPDIAYSHWLPEREIENHEQKPTLA